MWQMSKLVQSSILYEESSVKRMAVVVHWIDVAQVRIEVFSFSRFLLPLPLLLLSGRLRRCVSTSVEGARDQQPQRRHVDHCRPRCLLDQSAAGHLGCTCRDRAYDLLSNSFRMADDTAVWLCLFA
jgi:hypothetical protein